MNFYSKILLILLILTFSSCKSQRNIDAKILNSYLKEKKISTISERTDFNKTPNHFIKMYTYWFNKVNKKGNENNEFNKLLFNKVEWIFDNEDIAFILDNYQQWDLNHWEENEIKTGTTLKKSNAIYKISRPFYNKKNDKAMIVVSVNNGALNGSINLVLFKKNEKGNWESTGVLLVSIN